MFGTLIYTALVAGGSCWAYRSFGGFKWAVDRVLNLVDNPEKKPPENDAQKG